MLQSGLQDQRIEELQSWIASESLEGSFLTSVCCILRCCGSVLVETLKSEGRPPVKPLSRDVPGALLGAHTLRLRKWSRIDFFPVLLGRAPQNGEDQDIVTKRGSHSSGQI